MWQLLSKRLELYYLTRHCLLVTFSYSNFLSPEPQRPKSLLLDNLPAGFGGNSSRASSPVTGMALPPGRRNSASPASSSMLFVPDVEEIRVSPVISKRGTLNILDQRTKVWKRRWVVVRRPYVFLYRDERDPCERGLINLARAHTEYSTANGGSGGGANGGSSQQTKSTFSITATTTNGGGGKTAGGGGGGGGGFLVQTANEKELNEWLYAINPLLAGQIRYVLWVLDANILHRIHHAPCVGRRPLAPVRSQCSSSRRNSSSNNNSNRRRRPRYETSRPLVAGSSSPRPAPSSQRCPSSTDYVGGRRSQKKKKKKTEIKLPILLVDCVQCLYRRC